MGPVWGGRSAAAAAAHIRGTVYATGGAARDGGRTRGTRPRRRASPAPPACRPPWSPTHLRVTCWSRDRYDRSL